jgi:hypothetical protein
MERTSGRVHINPTGEEFQFQVRQDNAVDEEFDIDLGRFLVRHPHLRLCPSIRWHINQVFSENSSES